MPAHRLFSPHHDPEPEGVEDIEGTPEEGEALEGDYVFTLKIDVEEDPEDIIAKFYKNEDDDFWKVRVVQGDEQPLEDMQFDPELDMVEIIEKIKYRAHSTGGLAKFFFELISVHSRFFFSTS